MATTRFKNQTDNTISVKELVARDDTFHSLAGEMGVYCLTSEAPLHNAHIELTDGTKLRLAVSMHRIVWRKSDGVRGSYELRFGSSERSDRVAFDDTVRLATANGTVAPWAEGARIRTILVSGRVIV